jgi:hypothetical protein
MALDRWVKVLQSGGAASQLLRLQTHVSLLIVLICHGLWNSLRPLARLHPIVGGAIGALGVVGAATLLRRVSPELRGVLRDGMSEFVNFASEFLAFRERSEAAFRSACPPAPDVAHLSDLEQAALLRRFVLSTASAQRQVSLSAHDIWKLLPDLGVAQREQLIRAELRASAAFRETSRGRFAVGVRGMPCL